MQSFTWGDNFETGIAEIDDQHRKLVEIINNFGVELAGNSVASEEVGYLMQQLFRYAEKHFEDEERLMAESGLDPRHFEPHVAEHKIFIEDVVFRYKHDCQNNGGSGTAFLEFLINWLAYHILVRDKNMARQVEVIKGGATPESAFINEEREASDSTEPLVAALKGLFLQVSKRNKELLQLNENLEAKVEERTRELVKANADLETLALTDVLTELPNRRHALLQLQELWKEAQVVHGDLACMVIDADGFKSVNDNYGHDAGDIVLKRLARELKHSVRSDDIVCRMGGDEFLILCPNTPIDGALYVAEQVRNNVSSLDVEAGAGAWRGSVSIGVAVNNRDVGSTDELLKEADNGVYQAKKDGRNCVRTTQSQSA